jgi:uncharacterized membrane protein YkoI
VQGKAAKGDIMKRIGIAVLFAAFALTAGAATHPPKTKITMAAARTTALKKAPGTVKSEELENEHGKWIYSFDIVNAKHGVTEVNVDAMTGAIVDVQHETAAKEAAEQKSEKKTAKPKKP